ncbi:ThuA domain-containing protein [Compostimonas suwonensis]|uniref:LPXTG-motif cell wall-anchored protein n=1 Tax=Compostimonas suwonensis TaxID=1048394 RepID=A0A2M9BWW9_9MICO|nr:ThuA domain-containing protein [Compostimonas suwonensis]PJJ62421.1 LPXTG-motif cell wall-anchored protein [Compostimonas suwonensis]
MVATGLLASATPANAQAAPAVVPLAEPVPASDFKALVFSKTAGFRHGSIPAGISAIQQLGEENNFEVDVTEDATAFTAENLKDYAVVIWLSTTGDVLNAEQQTAFEEYIQNGGGYAGVHAASDTEYDWPWYGELVGAYFSGHPAEQNAVVKVEDHAHPSTAHLPEEWDRFDEWYNFRTNPRTNVHVLAALDEKSYTGGTMGVDHPTAWCQNYDGGTSWYTGGGHTDASYADPAFLEHLLGGIQTAAGAVSGDCNATQSGSYELVPLDTETGNPMAMDIAPDGSVFYAERNGRVQRIDPVSLDRNTALTLNVTTGNEDGLLGIALDPDFATNGWVYVYWAPNTVTPQDGPHNRVSRYTYNTGTKTFDPASEKVVLKVTTQRNTCCHAGGDMLFDNDDNLVLALGDNSNPFESDGYAPIDERAGRQDYDSQRSSANTNDLRGKVLKIHPEDDGTYTIPEGNLFDEADDTADKTRPEIFAMGFRNPFRIGLDPYTNNILVADYGPDAGSANPNRGPGGTVEWNILDEPGNYGWPLCVGIKCYKDFNFETQVSGAEFNPAAPVNNSPNNTGLTNLPPVIVPEWWTENGTTALYPEIGNSGAPMGGPVYQYDPDLDSDTKWPEYWDGKAIFAEWNSGRMFSFQLNEDGPADERHSKIQDINRILPDIFDPSKGFNKSMDFEFGPDGALYVIDWGSDFGGNTANSGIYRVDYVQANPSPIARASANVTDGPGPSLEVQFSSEGTRHPVGVPYTIEWDFGDGTPRSTEQDPIHTYTQNGVYTAKLTATDEDGKTAIANVQIVVGNALPTVSIEFPENGGFFTWGDDVAYKVTVTDPDSNTPIDCEKVTLVPALGHDSHNHDFNEVHGCEGSFPTARDAGHGLEANLFWVVNASYQDDGGQVGVPLTGYGTNVLNATHMEAEYFDQTGRVNGTGGDADGVRTEGTGDSAGGGRNLSNVEGGDWWSYTPVNLKGMEGVTMRLAKGTAGGGNIAVRWGDPVNGQLLGNLAFTPTNRNGTPNWQEYSDFTLNFDQATLPTGTGEIYFILTQGGVNVNYMNWIGEGVDSNSPPTVELAATPKVGSAPLVVNATATAADPEGTAVTYRWDQGTGDGFVNGTATQQFTYDTPGNYALKVRAVDAEGAYTEKQVTIAVATPGSTMCLTGRSDGFDGTTLDTGRWNRIVRPNQDARVENGHLVIPASKTDIYGGGGTVPNIVLQDLPSGAWQATTKVTLEARTQYQQAGLIVYGDDNNYAKVALQGRGTGEDAAQRVIQWIREVDGTPNEGAQSNSPALGNDFPDTFYVRLTSDGTNLNASYSADGESFTVMPETKPLAGIVNPRIGLLAYANDGSPADVIEAHFDWFSITPDDTAVAETPNDEFDGTSLNSCRWAVVNEQPAGYRVADGGLQIDTTPNDIYGGDTGVPNFIVQAQPEGDEWVIETKVDASAFDRQYQQGGLILYGDDDNYVKMDILSTNQSGSPVARNVELRNEIGGVVQNPQPNGPAPDSGIVWLRLAKSGDVFTGWSSVDGENWTQIAETVTNATLGAARVGLYALGNVNQGQVSNTAVFDYFHVVEEEEPEPEPVEVSATVAPASPNGSNGWYTQNVSVTVETTGGGDSTVYREYKLDGAANWSEYTGPVVVSADGEHTVQYRASAPGDTTEVESVSFKIDKTAPQASAALSPQRAVTITSTDATSGPGSVQYKIDAGEWVTYSAPFTVDDTEQTITYRATDAAGNAGSENTLGVPAVPVDPEDPVLTVDVTLTPADANANGWYKENVTVTAVGTSTSGDSPVVEYSTNGGETFQPVGSGYVISAEGTTTVQVRATEGEFHSATVSNTVKLDKTVPTVTGSASDARLVTIAGTDAGSGIDTVEYALNDGEWTVYAAPIQIGDEAATVAFRATDLAGNVSTDGSVSLEAVEEEPEPEPTPSLVVDDQSVEQGGLITVTGADLAPNTEYEVWLESEPILLATIVTDEDGAFSDTFMVPLDFAVGEHHIVVYDAEGAEVVRSATITVTAAEIVDPTDPGEGDGNGEGDGSGNGGNVGAGNGGGSLPNTGADQWQTMLPLAMMLLIGGLGALLVVRRARKLGEQE